MYRERFRFERLHLLKHIARAFQNGMDVSSPEYLEHGEDYLERMRSGVFSLLLIHEDTFIINKVLNRHE